MEVVWCGCSLEQISMQFLCCAVRWLWLLTVAVAAVVMWLLLCCGYGCAVAVRCYRGEGGLGGVPGGCSYGEGRGMEGSVRFVSVSI